MSQIKMKPNSVIIANLGLQPKGPVQQWFTDTCALHMDKYVPFRHGELAKTVVVNGEVNRDNVTENTITYKQNYASYVYYGMREDETHKIQHYTQDTHELAGPYWDKRMWSAEKEQVVKEVQNYFNIRGRK